VRAHEGEGVRCVLKGRKGGAEGRGLSSAQIEREGSYVRRVRREGETTSVFKDVRSTRSSARRTIFVGVSE